MGRLFGTDGARGVANAELTCETAMAIGRAAAMVLLETEGHRPRVVIGKDTRISSDMVSSSLRKFSACAEALSPKIPPEILVSPSTSWAIFLPKFCSMSSTV